MTVIYRSTIIAIIKAMIQQNSTKRRLILIFLLTIALFVTNWSELFIQRNQNTIGWGISRSFLFVLINAHIIAIVLLLYLIIRQSIKLFTERSKQLPGSSFKKNLFFAFALFSVIPSFFIFFSAGKFITTSIDDWFHARISNGLYSALVLHKAQTQDQRSQLKQLGESAYHLLIASKDRQVSTLLQQQELNSVMPSEKHRVFIWPASRQQLYVATKQEVSTWRSFRRTNDRTTKTLRQELTSQLLKKSSEHIIDFYGSLYWVKRYNNKLLIVVYRFPKNIRMPLIQIQNSLNDYHYLKSMRNPIYTNYIYTFFLITLLILFLSIWCAFYLSRGLSKPIQNLIQVMQQLKKGKWDSVVTSHPNSDLKSLEQGFNEMIGALQQAHQELARKNKETLTILENIKASVFFINPLGRIITYNKAAKEITEKYLGISRFKNKRVNFFGPKVTAIFFKLVRTLNESSKDSLSEEVTFAVDNEQRNLMVHMTMIRNQRAFNHSEKKGVLIVVEDLTELVKANKIKTWREAAKQMAHELKNPLTPIQLATQRLQRKYKSILSGEPAFMNCTETILQQVAIVKKLISYFSEFASMPSLTLDKTDLNQTVEQTMRFYTVSNSNITFFCSLSQEVPVIISDAKKIKRIIINLLDNSIRALSSIKQKEKIIKISTSHDPVNKLVKIIVADNGPGIDKSVKDKLFLPYVSSNKKNMGLGLAIVHDAVNQLRGSINLLPSAQGAVFQITLPTKSGKVS